MKKVLLSAFLCMALIITMVTSAFAAALDGWTGIVEAGNSTMVLKDGVPTIVCTGPDVWAGFYRPNDPVAVEGYTLEFTMSHPGKLNGEQLDDGSIFDGWYAIGLTDGKGDPTWAAGAGPVGLYLIIKPIAAKEAEVQFFGCGEVDSQKLPISVDSKTKFQLKKVDGKFEMYFNDKKVELKKGGSAVDFTAPLTEEFAKIGLDGKAYPWFAAWTQPPFAGMEMKIAINKFGAVKEEPKAEPAKEEPKAEAKAEASKEEPKKAASNPKTGDVSTAAYILAVGASGLFLLKRKKL